MRFQMARHLGWLTRDQAAGASRTMSAIRSRPLAAQIPPDLPPPEFSDRDYLSYLLYIDAEIEQGLMVQYLYAAYSLGGPRPRLTINVNYGKGQFGPRYCWPDLSPTLDRNGRFRIQGLIPGVRYDVASRTGNTILGEICSGLTLRPGESRDLGEVKAKSR